MLRYTILSTLIVFMGLSLSACETMEGAGRDIQHAGQAVEGAAE